MIAPKTMPYASEGRRARGHCDDEAGEGALEAHGAECDGDGGVGRFEGSGDRRPTERPTKKSKRAPVEEPPKPLTKELPEVRRARVSAQPLGAPRFPRFRGCLLPTHAAVARVDCCD